MLRSRILLSVVFSVALALAKGSPPLQFVDQRGLPVAQFPLKGISASSSKVRLPSNLQPVNYKLDIVPILDDSLGEDRQFTAPGVVEITINCLEATNEIILNSRDITFTTSDVVVRNIVGGAQTEVTEVTHNSDDEIVTISLGANLFVNEAYAVIINFKAVVNNDMDGLYRSSYIDASDNQIFLATTQFEKSGARRAFPCFDEPAMRATFDIRIGRRIAGGYHALSNMPKVGTSDKEIPHMRDFIYDEFEQTLNMPTYLIAIIVSNFIDVNAVPGDHPAVVKIWGPPNQMGDEAAVFSAQVGAKLLTFFQQYFDIAYNMPKLDSVAIPDFAAGAMENWGLNTYRIPTLLFVHGDMTQYELWRQAAVISHEVSHSWFGNLVTINWWNDLWLKEGFARYLQFLGVAVAEPNMEAMERVVLDTIQIAMEQDIGPNTHAIRGEWSSPIEYQNSRIIYEKGASLIRMMQGFLNEATLQTALRKYLNLYNFGSTIQSQLFNELTKEAHVQEVLPFDKDVNAIMDSWTTQSGFPLVRIQRGGPNKIYASQEKFFAIDPQGTGDYNGRGTWEIPITFSTRAEPILLNYIPKAWIGVNALLTSIPVETTDEWILVNPDARSYYRVLYDAHLFDLLKSQLDEDHSQFTSSTRSQLLDDYFTFVLHSYSDIYSAFELTNFLHGEESLNVWTTVLNHLQKIFNYLSDDIDLLTMFKTYVATKVEPQLRRLMDFDTYPEDDPVASILRGQLFSWGCSLDLSNCIDTSLQLMEEWRNDQSTNPVVADIQSTVYCTAYAIGDDVLKQFITDQYNNPLLSEKQRGLLLKSRGCETDPVKLNAMLIETIDIETTIPVVNRKELIQQISRNEVGRDLILPFLDANIIEIMMYLGDDTITSSIAALTLYFTSAVHLDAIEAFAIKYDGQLGEGVEASIQTSRNQIITNQRWTTRNSKLLTDWLIKTLPSNNNAI